MYKFIFILFLITKTVSAQSKKDIQEELKFTKAKLDSFQTLYFQQQILLQQIFQKVLFYTNLKILLPAIFIGQKKLKIYFLLPQLIAPDTEFQEQWFR